MNGGELVPCCSLSKGSSGIVIIIKSTQSRPYSFFVTHPPYQKSPSKMLIFRPLLKIAMHHKRQRTAIPGPFPRNVLCACSWKWWQFSTSSCWIQPNGGQIWCTAFQSYIVMTWFVLKYLFNDTGLWFLKLGHSIQQITVRWSRKSTIWYQ